MHSIDKTTYDSTVEFFEQLMIILHPYMPFITEEIWHQLRERKDGEDCIVSPFPSVDTFDEPARPEGQSGGSLIKNMETLNEVITSIRDLRNKNGISKNDSVTTFHSRIRYCKITLC